MTASASDPGEDLHHIVCDCWGDRIPCKTLCGRTITAEDEEKPALPADADACASCQELHRQLGGCKRCGW